MRWALLFTFLFQKVIEIASTVPYPQPFDNFPTLEDHYSYLKARMPNRHTQLFEYPSTTELEAWENVTFQMLNATTWEECPSDLPQSLVDLEYEAGSFYDDNLDVTYCILSTTRDFAGSGEASSPLGIFITNPNVDNCMITTSAHPRNDLYTGDQAMITFKGSGAKAFATSGAHRYATDLDSVCQGNYAIADDAHNIAAGLQSVTKAIKKYYELNPCDYTVIQFHGMGSTSCPGDAYLTYGGNYFLPHANEKIDVLRNCIVANQPNSFIATFPGEEPYCGLAGYTNTQGRYLNNVPADKVCNTRAVAHTTTFIHYEQVRWLREPAQYSSLTNGINCAIEHIPNASPPAPPPTCNITSPAGGDQWRLGSQVNITWDISGIRDATFKVSTANINTADQTYDFSGTIEYEIDAESQSLSVTVGGDAMELGSNRAIRLRHNGNSAIKCYSEPFSIVHQFSGIFAAHDGGLTIQRKKYVMITWPAHPDLCPKVKLSWHRYEESVGYYRTIAHEADNTGSYNYYMSSTFRLASDYSLRIRCTSDTSIKYYSYMNELENPSDPKFYTIISH